MNLSMINIGSKKISRRLGQQSGRLSFSVLEKNSVNNENTLYLVPERFVISRPLLAIADGN